MSRIYEALQKAEAERNAERPHHPQDESQPDAFGYHHAATALADPDAERSEVYTQNFAEHSQTFHETAAFPPAPVHGDDLPRRVPGFDLDAVHESVWAPNFHVLPSVLERGPAVEQFRSLRSRLYELRDKAPLKTVMVTSGLPQEGKSFISANLAISLARNQDARVLLIDGDMRRYTVHHSLGCQRVPGLADFLADRAHLQDVVQRCNVQSSAGSLSGATVRLPPLTVIAGGNGGDNAADLSNNDHFEELIRTLAPLFDWIIVDSSPVLPVSDAVNLSRSCDGVLLVVRSGVTAYEDAQRTQSELRNANLIGVVLNAAPTLEHPSYYGYSAQHTSTPSLPSTPVATS